MHKDIIYIDTEDDITAIIGKIKASKDKIVALVPPKRIGALQSAVNLRLLARTAKNANKHLVLISNNKALMALSASAKIPVAKNLQSKPEIAEIAALEIDDEDVIEGAKLPIGELVKTVDNTRDKDETVEDALDDIDIDNDDSEQILIQPTDSPKADDSKKVKEESKKVKKVKIPDFNSFRKKLFFGGAGFIAFVVFMVWATQYAPAARIIITAKTSSAPVSTAVKLIGTGATDISKGTIQSIVKQLKKDVSVEFTATGKEKKGDKSTGTITLSNSDNSDPIEVLAGSVFSKGDYNFVTTATVNVPGADVVRGEIVAGTINVGIVAEEIGSEYNLTAGNYVSSVDGVAATASATTGGSSHDAVVVTADDILKANQMLMELSSDSVKKQLTKQFVNGEFVIADSFTVDRADAVSTPAVGGELTAGKAKLTSATTFSITAIAKSEIQAYLKEIINKQVSNNQRIYDDGIDEVKLVSYSKIDTQETVNITTTGKIGPDISEAIIKKLVKGKGYGDVQSTLGSIKGVSDVDTKFSYFWVTTVPDDLKKITVEFQIDND